MNGWNPRTGHVVAFIDLGTNSVRLLVVRLNPNCSYTVMTQEKEVVRLGEKEFVDRTLRREAMDRAVHVCTKFAELSRTYGADEIIAVATSAAREASNQGTLVERMKEEAGIDLGIISGKEEARLIFQGVRSAIDLGARTALFVDIGGGSTEVIVGDQNGHSFLDSLKLGAIRTTAAFLPDGYKGPIEDSVYNKMKRHARSEMVHTVKAISKRKFDLAVGSSGTIMNLAEMAARAYGGKPGILRMAHLKKLTAMMRAMTLEQRKLVPGINPERADIILGGAAILEAFMEDLKVEELTISERGVLNGLLVDYLSGIEGYPHAEGLSIRDTSVLQLGRSCNIDEGHARTVTRIALELFDSAQAIGLHDLSKKDRELLRHASFLHDVGDFISFNNHHAHSYYIVRNADLLGFEGRELATMANLVRYHRKRPPRRKDPTLQELDEKTQQKIIIMSTFLRLAETLDRSHANLVSSVQFKKGSKNAVVLEVTSDADVSLEVWGVENHVKAFKQAFDRDLSVEVKGPRNDYGLAGPSWTT
ncbi:MAG: Ppx/GppA phosphatase family protein [Methanomassiliicoccus sp.]|nr:Ppx/GppA phosphatase family protein [Methanomassiliicoccus sp.]